jgi:predicted small secreted protein
LIKKKEEQTTMLKKLLTLALVAVGVFSLAACGGTTEEGLTDLEKLGEALVEVDLPSEASTDLTFPTTGLHDVEITWESDNTDVIANDGTVTIPTKTMGDQTVTITAFLTIGDNTLTKEFDVTV